MTNEQLIAACVSFFLGGGGLVAFLKWAFNAWLADRKEERAERKGEFSALIDIQLTLSAMLERDRIREDRRKRESNVPQNQSWDDGRNTDVHEIKRVMRDGSQRDRVQTPPGGIRSPRPGTRNEDR